MNEQETYSYQDQPFVETQEDKIEKFARYEEIPTVAAVGLGGAGCNVITWTKEKGISGGKLVAVNTDATHLRIVKADKRILIGEKLTHGMGAGGYPDIGERALHESANEVIHELTKSNIIFLSCGFRWRYWYWFNRWLSRYFTQEICRKPNVTTDRRCSHPSIRS